MVKLQEPHSGLGLIAWIRLAVAVFVLMFVLALALVSQALELREPEQQQFEGQYFEG